MSKLRRHKRLLAWFSAVAVLCNVLVGAFGQAQAKTALVVDEVLGPLIICTADGAKSESADGGSHRQNPAEHCPACVLHAQVALAVAIMAAGNVLPAPLTARPTPIGASAPAVQLSIGGVGSRAPPLSA